MSELKVNISLLCPKLFHEPTSNPVPTSNIFFLIFGGHHSFFEGEHCYPCFGLLVMSALGFKATVGSFIHRIQENNLRYC